MKKLKNLSREQSIKTTQEVIAIIGNFIYDTYVPDSWELVEIEKFDDKFIFHWTSSTEQTKCPECGMISYSRTNTYKKRILQDLPISGMTVYHEIKSNRYYCNNPECKSKSFVEQFSGITIKDARLTDRLKDYVIRQGIESTSSGTAKSLFKLGIRVSRETVSRLIKNKGAQVIKQNLARTDVKALSIDDINLRKGNSSTACSVFLDAQTHRILAIVEGATSEIAKKVINQYPDSDIVSRDRGNAYAKAAKKLDKLQVADKFHLVKNIHTAVKDALSREMSHDLFLLKSNVDDQTKRVNSDNDTLEKDDLKSDDSRNSDVINNEIFSTDDIEKRIHLAGLNERQATKYRRTMAIIELAEDGLRTPEIAKRLSLKTIDVIHYRQDSSKTIDNVESKIDEYFTMLKKEKWEYHQKTIVKKAKPSSQSIVEPYKETVLRMFKEGKNHRNIYPVIIQEGFTGCANTVYQYLIKYAHENNIPYGCNSRIIPIEDRDNKNNVTRPPKNSIERVTRKSIYNYLLKTAAAKKEELKQSKEKATESESESDKMQDNNNKEKNSTPKNWANKSNYDDKTAKVIFNTEPKKRDSKKKLNENIFQRICNKITIIPHLLTFLIAFYEVLISLDVVLLDQFISKYKNDSNEVISTFASGLKRDYDAVKNSLLNPDISNGPIEGTNNKIKMIRRRGYGRIGIELLNALIVLPWYYKDIDKPAA